MKIIGFVLAVTLGGSAMAADKSAEKSSKSRAPVKLENDDQKTIYALGLAFGKQLGVEMSPTEMTALEAGISDALSGATPQVELETYGPKINELLSARKAVAATKAKGEAQKFLDKQAAEPGAQKSASGLIYKELKPGTGPSPVATDKVTVNYEGKLIDGTVFDSSYKRGQPASFPLGQVIKCWTEGVQKMKVGGTSQLVCPSDIAYGDQGHPPVIPGGATLIFKVELISIDK